MALGFCEECGAEYLETELREVKIGANYTRTLCYGCHLGVPKDDKARPCEECGRMYDPDKLKTTVTGEGFQRLCEECRDINDQWIQHAIGEKYHERKVSEHAGSVYHPTRPSTVIPPESKGSGTPGRKTVSIGSLREVFDHLE